MNKQSKKQAWNRPTTGTDSQDCRDRSLWLGPTHRNLVEAKNRMLGTAAYRGCGTHFPEHCHLYTRVSGKTALPLDSLFFLLPHGRVAFLHNLALVEHGMQAIVHSLDGSKDDSYHQAVHSSHHQAGGQDLEMTVKLNPFSEKP